MPLIDRFFFPADCRMDFETMTPFLDPELFRGLTGPPPEPPAKEEIPVVQLQSPPASDRKTRSKTRADAEAKKIYVYSDDSEDSVSYPKLCLPRYFGDYPEDNYSLAEQYDSSFLSPVAESASHSMFSSPATPAPSFWSNMPNTYGSHSTTPSVASTAYSISPPITPPSFASSTLISYASPPTFNSYFNNTTFQGSYSLNPDSYASFHNFYIPIKPAKIHTPQEYGMNVDHIRDPHSPSLESASSDNESIPESLPAMNIFQEYGMDVDQVQVPRSSPNPEPADFHHDLPRGTPSPEVAPHPPSSVASIPESLPDIETPAPIIPRQTRSQTRSATALNNHTPPTSTASSNASSSPSSSVASRSSRTGSSVSTSKKRIFKVTRSRGRVGKSVSPISSRTRSMFAPAAAYKAPSSVLFRAMRIRSAPASTLTASTSVGREPNDMNNIFNVTVDSDDKVLYTCKTCPDYKTRKKNDAQRHAEKKVHKSPSHTCLVCNAAYTRIDALRRHCDSKRHKQRSE